MPKVKCRCTSEYCGHSPNICGKPVSVTLRLKEVDPKVKTIFRRTIFRRQ
jgi:hypothetical protein